VIVVLFVAACAALDAQLTAELPLAVWLITRSGDLRPN